MPFYIRKSISAGPFRFNLSKSGVGLSVGVRGLRVGTGPRGHYVHAGIGGLYYRSSIGRAGERQRPLRPRESPSALDPGVNELQHPTVEMIEVESVDVLEMADSRFQTVLEDLNRRAEQPRMALVLGGTAAAVWFIVGLIISFQAAIILLPAIVVALAVGAYLDAYRRASVVFYDLDGAPYEAYLTLVSAYERLAACRGQWHVAAGGVVRDLDTWKRNAGAAHLVKRAPTAARLASPPVLKSNITPPSIGVGKQTLYFLPDMILVAHDGRFGAVAYDALQISCQPSRFIEDGAVPSDAQVVDHTWQYVNKKGGPDRRFKDNRQLPICLYEAVHFRSSGGLNELLEFSKTGVGTPFAEAVSRLAAVLKGTPKNTAASLPAA